MKSYRIYIVGKDGRLRLGDAFEAVADADAIARTQAVAVKDEAAELWEGGRLVGVVSPEGVFTAHQA